MARLVSSLAGAAVVAAQAPCDIYFSSNTPCVAAHSVTRALFSAYNGPLYSVIRSDGSTADISPVAAGGVANAAAQDSFCAGKDCFVLRIYDQTENLNHLDIGPPGGAARQGDKPVNATTHSITMNGQKVYGAYFTGGMGYRIDHTVGVATGNDPETIYMVTAGQIYNNGCCFDYGNAETNNLDDDVGK